MEGFKIVTDKDKIDVDLLLTADPSLPQVMRNLNQSYSFAGLLGDRTVAVCLLDKKDDVYDIVNLAIKQDFQNKGLAKEMVRFALDYVRAHGGRYVEAGAGNSNIPMYVLLQKLGFRVVGVWKNHFISDTPQPHTANFIVDRDMIRFQLDLRTDAVPR